MNGWMTVPRGWLDSIGEISRFCARVVGLVYSGRVFKFFGEALRQAGVGFVGLDQARVNADVARQARLAGLTLGVWTVNERDAIERFLTLGAGVVITDRPDLAKELLGR